MINQSYTQRVHRQGDTTYLYSPDDHIVAAMKQPKITQDGDCLPASYYVSSNLLQ
ncbi:MAG: hypothetical protein AAGF06_07120 [Pseudomonadota bacterium]